MDKKAVKPLWKPYQRDSWTREWEGSPYLLDEKIDGNKWVSVKDSLRLPHIFRYLSLQAR